MEGTARGEGSGSASATASTPLRIAPDAPRQAQFDGRASTETEIMDMRGSHLLADARFLENEAAPRSCRGMAGSHQCGGGGIDAKGGP